VGPKRETPSGYALFGHRQFRNLWGANLVLTLGLVMLMLGASWTMTSLTDDPVLVSMVQTVMSLPFVIFGIPVGVASDSLGHRTLLLASQFWMLTVTGLMGVIALTGGWDFTPALLLSTMFLVGIGVVVQQAAWKPFLHSLVPEDKLVAAISLNSLSNKISQTLGPILGGYLMGVAGTAVVLFTRAVSHVVMILAVLRESKRAPALVSAEKVEGHSLRDGWNTLRRSRPLHGPMVRCALLMVPCSGVLALLPLEAKENIQTGAIGYGGLLAALGLGTTVGVSLMPLLQSRIRLNPVSGVMLGVFALSTLGISQWDSMLLDAAFLFFFGFAWSVLSVSHQFAVQVSAPNEMRGLMTSLYALVLQGSMALGSLGFGVLAQHTGVSRSILIAGVVAMSGLLLVGVYRVPDADPEASAD
jgi:MFS family permease